MKSVKFNLFYSLPFGPNNGVSLLSDGSRYAVMRPNGMESRWVDENFPFALNFYHWQAKRTMRAACAGLASFDELDFLGSASVISLVVSQLSHGSSPYTFVHRPGQAQASCAANWITFYVVIEGRSHRKEAYEDDKLIYGLNRPPDKFSCENSAGIVCVTSANVKRIARWKNGMTRAFWCFSIYDDNRLLWQTIFDFRRWLIRFSFSSFSRE